MRTVLAVMACSIALMCAAALRAQGVVRNDGAHWPTLHGDLTRAGFNPAEQTFYAFDIRTGRQPWVAPIFYTAGLHDPPSMPCCDPQTGEVFALVRSAFTVWDGGGEVRPLTGAGKLDLQNGRVSLLDHGYRPREPIRPAGSPDLPYASFNTIGDETQSLSCAPGLLLSNHQGFLGMLDLQGGQCRRLFGLRDTYAGLRAHVGQLLTNWPLRPMHHTLGISGYEVEFSHPDQLFGVLAMSCPFLEPAEREAVQHFLDDRLQELPPYGLTGFDPAVGQPREAYLVPEHLRSRKPVVARSALGVYAFWAYCQYADRTDQLPTHWPHIVTRMESLLSSGFEFDMRRTDYRQDEAQRLNGNVAGLVGFVRLARSMNDARVARRGAERLRQGLQLRVNLERVNPRFVEPTRSASNELHNFKLARYCDLTPEVAELLRLHTEGLSARRLANFRQARNGWCLAFGDRLIGGENYTNSLSFSRSLFSGAALLERLPGQEVAACLDVPWCEGDVYFLEKCVYALWASQDWPVKTPPSPLRPNSH